MDPEILLGGQDGSAPADPRDNAALRAGHPGDLGMDAQGALEPPRVAPDNAGRPELSGDRRPDLPKPLAPKIDAPDHFIATIWAQNVV